MVSDAEVASTYPVMRQLRPHLEEDEYLERIRRMQGSGYRIAAVVDGGRVACVAGFRIQEYLHRGKHMYVDDLVTDETARSMGHGGLMFDWLLDEARRNGCGRFHLDSGVQRSDAHRFYFREGMSISAYHFSRAV
jgi:GNAT superfamily N-acetyltransferase